MLEWLNKTIGTDWATYVGVFLAIIPLVWGGKQLITRKTNSQNVKANNSTVVQVGGNLNVGNKNESKSRR